SPFVFVVLFGDRARLGADGRLSLLEQLFALFIQTDHWLGRIVGPFVEIEHFIHAPPEFGRHFPNAPHHFAPRFTDVFFRKRRMLSRLIFFIPLSSRAACVSNRTVQRLAPAGGSVQAKATTLAS